MKTEDFRFQILGHNQQKYILNEVRDHNKKIP